MLIKNLFERDIFRPINGVVKADQLDDSSVWQELDPVIDLVSEQLADKSAIETMHQAHDREFDAQQRKAKGARDRLTKKLDKLTEDLRATFDSKNIESMSTPSQARVRKRISIEIDAIEESLEYLRGNKLAITVFESYDDIVDKACEAWTFFAHDKDRIASITTRSWASVIP